MEYVIKNDYLEAVISSKGAELIKLIDKDGLNRLHTPSNDTWNGVSPILFPLISRLRNDSYTVNNSLFKMGKHGFIRGHELEVYDIKENEITFFTKEDESTLEVYPYKFNFYVTYRLIDNLLDVSFKIHNSGDTKLYYMLGGHPAFKVPLYDYEKYSDYSLLFKKKETAKRMVLVDGYLSDFYEEYLHDQDIIHLEHELFTVDTLIFKDLRSNYVEIVSKNHDKKIRFDFSDFEYFAIWSKVDEKTDFVCLEPWTGIQKEFVLEHGKMGVLEIEKGDYSYHSYSIVVI